MRIDCAKLENYDLLRKRILLRTIKRLLKCYENLNCATLIKLFELLHY